jgi:hypothetical protein
MFVVVLDGSPNLWDIEAELRRNVFARPVLLPDEFADLENTDARPFQPGVTRRPGTSNPARRRCV